MEFIFQDKHATGEFTSLHTSYNHVSDSDKDFFDNKNASDAKVNPATYYDSDCLSYDTNNESSTSMCPKGGNHDKGKRVSVMTMQLNT